jgi:hypothetical protein
VAPVEPPVAAPGAADLEVLAAWAPELADTFVALSCDLALVIDADGRVARFAQHDSHPIAPPSWVGQAWAATASEDSRAKVEQMLAEVAATGHGRRREINHPQALGGPASLAYSAVRLGTHGPVLAIGHDLRAQMVLQQRYLAAQEALERSYWNAQRRPRARERPAVMTGDERQRLGLDATPALDPRSADLADSELLRALDPRSAALADSELLRALGRLYDRIGQDGLPDLLRDARRLTERHFLARAVHRAGGVDALAQALGVSRRSLMQRGASAGRRRKR